MARSLTIASVAGVSLAFWLVTSLCAAGPMQPDATRVLAAARTAYGRADWSGLGVLVQTGSESASGLNGHWRLAEDVAGGQMHQSVNFGVYRVAETWGRDAHWRQDQSGGVHLLNSAFARSYAVTQRWIARRGYLRDDAGDARVAYLGAQDADHRAYETLRATPTGGEPVELWFDKATGLLARSIWTLPIEIVTLHYDDYRRVGPVMIPFKTVAQSDYSDSPDTTTLTDARFVAKADAGEFAPLTTPNDSTVAGGVTTVPISYEGYVVFDAMLNGKGPYSFILDSGGHDILSPAAAKALGLTGAGAGASGGAGAGKVAEQFTRIDRVDIGGATLRNQAFYIDELQFNTVERGAKTPLAGIMGLELFERFAMMLDYRKQSLTLRPLAGAPPGHGVAVPITFTDDQPTYTAKIDGIAGPNGLDTGNGGALVVQGRWAERVGLAPAMRKGLVTAGFGAGGMSRNWAVRADVEVAGISFPRIVASYAEDKKGSFSSRVDAGNIGNQIYENFTLSFDYARNTVWFEPQPGPRQQARSYPGTGMSVFKEAADAFTVAVVLPGMPAAQAGIVAGDKIVSVNGVPATTISGWDYAHIVRKAPGTKLTLEIQHRDQTRTVVLALRDLLP